MSTDPSEQPYQAPEDDQEAPSSERSLAAVLRIWFQRLGPLVMLLMLVGLFMFIAGDGFRTLGNFKTILVHAVILVTATLGMTMILISGGLDLSVGSSIALGCAVGAVTLQLTGSTVLAALACVATCTLVGAANGFFISVMRMSPFIVTLGMLGMARGMARVVTGDSHISILQRGEDGKRRHTWLNDLMEASPSLEPMASLGFPIGLVVMVLLCVLAAIMMRRSVFGRHVYAIGSNEEAARLCGVPVVRDKFLIYTLGGLLFGIAALMNLSYDNAGNSTTRMGFELEVIAAVVIGGASLTGGSGTVIGSIIGAFIIVVMNNGFVQAGVAPAWQAFAIGCVIVAAVALDMFRRGTLYLPGMKRR